MGASPSPTGIRFQLEILDALDTYASHHALTRSQAVNDLLRLQLSVAQSSRTRETGARPDAFGLQMARHIAMALGATPVPSSPANEFRLGRRTVAIKLARRGNPQIGVYVPTLDRVEAIVAGIETGADSGAFDLYEIPVRLFRERSRAAPRGARELVGVGVFRAHGRSLGRVSRDGS